MFHLFWASEGSVTWLKCEDSRVSSNPWNYGHVLLVVIIDPYLLRTGGCRPSNPKPYSSRFSLNNTTVSHHLFYVWISPLASQNSQLKLSTIFLSMYFGCLCNKPAWNRANLSPLRKNTDTGHLDAWGRWYVVPPKMIWIPTKIFQNLGFVP